MTLGTNDVLYKIKYKVNKNIFNFQKNKFDFFPLFTP